MSGATRQFTTTLGPDALIACRDAAVDPAALVSSAVSDAVAALVPAVVEEIETPAFAATTGIEAAVEDDEDSGEE